MFIGPAFQQSCALGNKGSEEGAWLPSGTLPSDKASPPLLLSHHEHEPPAFQTISLGSGAVLTCLFKK